MERAIEEMLYLSAFMQIDDMFQHNMYNLFMAEIQDSINLERAISRSEEENQLSRDDSIELVSKSSKPDDKHITTNCAICLDPISGDDNIIELECSHVFHYDCISSWVKYKAECPQCKKCIDVIKKDESVEEVNEEISPVEIAEYMIYI